MDIKTILSIISGILSLNIFKKKQYNLFVYKNGKMILLGSGSARSCKQAIERLSKLPDYQGLTFLYLPKGIKP